MTTVIGAVRSPMRENSTKPARMSRRTTLRHSRFASDPTYVRFGPTLTPMSTASTAAGPDTKGKSTSTAGKLLTTLDSSAATAAMPSNAGNVVPLGNASRMALSSPLSMTAATTTPRHSTNAKNGTSSASTMPDTVLRPRARACTPSTTAPASRAHAGDNPNSDATANPMSVNASTTSANTGIGTSSASTSCVGATDRSRAKTQRSNRNSMPITASQGSVMTAVKWTNDSPAAPNANRFVRLDTGSSSEALFARCAVA